MSKQKFFRFRDILLVVALIFIIASTVVSNHFVSAILAILATWYFVKKVFDFIDFYEKNEHIIRGVK